MHDGSVDKKRGGRVYRHLEFGSCMYNMSDRLDNNVS